MVKIHKLVKAVIITSLLLALTPFALASNMHGVMMVVKGEVKVVSAKDGQSQKAKMGFKVYPSDKIITGADSRAKIVMIDKNVINISPDTEMSIDTYINDGASGTKKVDLSVLKGKIRSTVMEKYDGEKNTYKVKTPTAVAGVRGTDFLTGHDPVTNRSQFVTFHGKVAVSMNGPGLAQMPPVMVSAGQSLSGSPSGLSAVTPVAPSELLSVNQESSADGQAFEQDDNRLPAQDTPASEPKKEGEGPATPPAAEPSETSAQTPAPAPAPSPAPPAAAPPEERAPASAPPSSSMVKPGDVSPGLGKEIVLTRTAPPQLPIVAQPPRLPSSPVTPELVGDQIRSGRAKVRIEIKGP